MQLIKGKKFQKLFQEEIFKVSLAFRKEILEQKYMKERNNINIHYKIVILISFFSFYMMSIRLIENFCNYKFNLDQEVDNGSLFLYAGILFLFSMSLEIIPILCEKVSFLKGLLVSLIPFALGIYQSYNFSVQSKSVFPMFFPVCMTYEILLIPISFVYCHNWICGELLIAFQCIGTGIYLAIYPSKDFDKFILTFLNLLSFVSLGSCLRFLEFVRRQNFFKTYLAKEQNKNTKNILKLLPDPLIIV